MTLQTQKDVISCFTKCDPNAWNTRAAVQNSADPIKNSLFFFLRLIRSKNPLFLKANWGGVIISITFWKVAYLIVVLLTEVYRASCKTASCGFEESVKVMTLLYNIWFLARWYYLNICMYIYIPDTIYIYNIHMIIFIFSAQY